MSQFGLSADENRGEFVSVHSAFSDFNYKKQN